MPNWISSSISVYITKTANGFAVSATKDAPITECYVFATFADLKYWLEGQWLVGQQVA
jgi:hypothetical protein